MSIDHHIKGRAALLDAMPEAVFAEVAATADDEPSAGRKSPAGQRTATARWPTGTPGVFPLLVTRPGFASGLSALKGLVTTVREARLPDQMVADAPVALFSFLNSHLLARTSEGAGAVPAFDATAYPAMAALSPLIAGFGSLTEFDRTLDTVLAGIKDRAALRTLPVFAPGAQVVRRAVPRGPVPLGRITVLSALVIPVAPKRERRGAAKPAGTGGKHLPFLVKIPEPVDLQPLLKCRKKPLPKARKATPRHGPPRPLRPA
ncbi:hypothetical protein [Streptomyces sp. NPDC015350]|uniref:hypothetical protein n=1 Tax=Streptomyces sp. NPDC015350 TaxID=3364955 RepID=UPI0036FD8EDB